MVRPRGLEPLAYGLEGRRSIQLSYERIKNKNPAQKSMVRPIGVEPTTYRSEVCRSIQLSYKRKLVSNGVSGGNRTHDPQDHNLML